MTERVRVEFHESIAEILIDTPNDRNALDELAATEFTTAVEDVEGSDVRAAVLRGAADTFSAGGDLTQSPEAFVRAVDASIDGIIQIYTSDIPYVAAIRGAAVGGGFELAMACDFRVAGEGAVLALPEVTLGLMPPAGAVRFLAQVAGRATALEICLLGRRMSAAGAADRGLLTEVVPDEDVDEVALSLATELANNSGDAISAIKRSVNAAFPRPIDDGKWDLALARSLASGDDFAEGKQAFFEGRSPDF